MITSGSAQKQRCAQRCRDFTDTGFLKQRHRFRCRSTGQCNGGTRRNRLTVVNFVTGSVTSSSVRQ